MSIIVRISGGKAKNGITFSQPGRPLWRYAEADRVQTVIRPYLEALA